MADTTRSLAINISGNRQYHLLLCCYLMILGYEDTIKKLNGASTGYSSVVEQQVTLRSIPATQRQKGADAEGLQQDDYLSQVTYIYRCTESLKLSKQVSL